MLGYTELHALSSDTLPKVRTFDCQIRILIFARKKTYFAIFVNGLLVIKLFQLSNGDFTFFVAYQQRLQTLFTSPEKRTRVFCCGWGVS